MRQPIVLLIAAALVAGGALLVVAGGSALRARTEASVATGAPGDPATADETSQKRISTERPAFKGGAERRAAARAETPLDEEPAGDAGPAEPQIAAAVPVPSKAATRGDWKETTLFQPVAIAAGMLEAKGYRITIAGLEPVGADEACDFRGRSWPCGARARAAFRAWLRGRSVTCALPEQAGSDELVTTCQVGKQDVAAWLVENGWARAVGGGDYAQTGEAAMKAGKGMFGSPPAMTAPTSTPTGSELPAPPGAGADILSAPDPEMEPVAPTPPSGPLGAFPPAPAPPPALAQ